jgi:hydroxymethylglutaryl-CoA lyase
MQVDRLFLTECPRDAMQGIQEFIPTEEKINYLNSLLACGFHRLDFGSFVSPKAIPQLRDTAEVLPHLKFDSKTELLAIVANDKGVEQALGFDEIHFLGFPFSVSEQFQLRNTNANIMESKARLLQISKRVNECKKQLMVYLSMGFGNPYGDTWSIQLVVDFAKELHETMGITHVALSDTIGSATPFLVKELFSEVQGALPNLEIGVHLHTLPQHATALIDAAVSVGCQHFDSALLGIGGCPMAKDDLTGNLDTATILEYCVAHEIETGINLEYFLKSKSQATSLFSKYH